MALLEIENLRLSIGDTPILRDVDLVIGAGETMGLVGESGSGKSMTALTVMQLLPNAARAEGRVTFDGIDILSAPEAAMNRLRGDDIGMVFQEPMTALNPVKTIGEQVAEGIRWHTGANRADAEASARQILDRVGLPERQFPLSRYPHQLSGGQRQRVVIAIACALKPKLLIADEPTTALDVVLQAQILDLLRDLVAENRMGLLLISHDLAVVTDMADRVTIMRHGEVMEEGETAPTLSAQVHPYTRQLAEASMHVPARPHRDAARTDAANLLEVRDVVRDYPGRRVSLLKAPEPFRAVDGVSFSMKPGQSVALVGRSGCGKSTLARMILALDRPTAGEIGFLGETLTARSEEELKPARRNMQVVFQDPYGSFNPRHKVVRLVAEPLHLLDKAPSSAERREMVAQALTEVGLRADDMDKYPHEFSGGQRQRISIARALITRPKLIVADEPVSALDVSIRAQVLDLFADLNQRLGVAYLFITHDLTVARAITDEVMVMHDGRIVEEGRTDAVLDNPRSEAAKALVAAAPDLRRAIRRRLVEQG
ncbi:ABC transporter ATP-binding protein [Nitratireductor mangrovi]|uniref:ABC transporter ATP-binding protein n=1 Tax=Nitratireductor mangrovi TaxID=2599600 RepID=A0A5B8L594_9HYPH|nr:dipeptide ABC transporter ATP-binding protein [Nitratireductor mangrovi]QDZ02903.1 ABC transporter ATP-binding protein [Nitratireductor mangrovi]